MSPADQPNHSEQVHYTTEGTNSQQRHQNRLLTRCGKLQEIPVISLEVDACQPCDNDVTGCTNCEGDNSRAHGIPA